MKLDLQNNIPKKIRTNNLSTIYLYEVYAIPENIRIMYHNKLSKRKNAEVQKNVKLLKIIYKIIQKDEFNSWDTEVICKKVGFKTSNQLYWYKSKILNDLRNMLFRWEEKEKVIEQSKEYRDSNQLLRSMLKIRKMREIGMRKEAKIILLRLLKKLEKQLSKYDPLTLSEIYEYLLDYYFEQRNLNKFNRYFIKLKELVTITRNLPQKDKSLVKVRYLITKAKKSSLHSHILSHALNTKEYLEKALSETEREGWIDYKLYILNRLIYVSKNLLRVEPDKEYLIQLAQDGFILASKHNRMLQKYVFEAELMLLGVPKQSNFITLSLFKRNYGVISGINKYGWWTIQFLNRYLEILHINSINKYNEFYHEVLRYYIINSYKVITFLYFFGENYYTLIKKATNNKNYYILQSNKHSKCSNFNTNYFIILGKPALRDLNQITSLLDDTFHKLRNLYEVDIKIKLLVASIEVEFLKGIQLNIDKAESLICKINRLVKKWGIYDSYLNRVFEFYKTGIAMFEKARLYSSKNYVIEKYFKYFSELANQLIQENHQNINVGGLYLYLSHIARELNYPELWQVVQDQWNYLIKHQPQIIESLKTDIKEHQEDGAVAA